MTTWSDVADVSTSWSASISRYVLEGYIADQANYVFDGSSPITWSDAADASSSWSAASSASTTWSASSAASTTWSAA